VKTNIETTIVNNTIKYMEKLATIVAGLGLLVGAIFILGLILS
jgi:hypothetical protein